MDNWVATRSPWLSAGKSWDPETEEWAAERAQQQARVEREWAAEREDWTAGEAFILDTGEMFDALYAIRDNHADRFTFAADREQTRQWLIPGANGGRVVEVEIRNGPFGRNAYLAGTDQIAPA
ncbi:hypothetical protein GCM10023087_18290 [Microbacterium rhizosphaerae]